MNIFSVRDTVRFGWERFKKKPMIFIGAMIIVFIVSLVTDQLGQAVRGAGVAELLAFIANLGVNMLMGMGIAAFFLKAHDNPEALSLADLWHPNPFWKYVAATLATGVIFAIGFVLLIVPGIIALTVFWFAPYIVIDRRLGPVEALKESARITRGNRLNLFILFGTSLGINLLGMLALFAGLLVSVPVTMLALIHAYRTLSGRAEAITSAPAPVAAA